MRTVYQTEGTCSSTITLDIENGVIQNVEFENGCGGNLTGLSRLIVGRSAAEVKALLAGVRCGARGTSCPDQLAKAIERAETAP